MNITITEALAEIKLINKKLESKKAYALANLTRYKHMPDLLGDSRAKLYSEMQSIADLETRIELIRTKIAEKNLQSKLSVMGQETTIYQWLTWKREIAPGQINFLKAATQHIKSQQDTMATRPQVWKDAEGKVQVFELIVNVDYSALNEKLEKLQETLDKLDGQLSLKNATLTIEI